MHQRGWYNADTPKFRYEDSSEADVTHDIVHLLDYDSVPCIEDPNYRNDFCRDEVIYKVPMPFCIIKQGNLLANGRKSSKWTRPFVGLSKSLKMVQIAI